MLTIYSVTASLLMMYIVLYHKNTAYNQDIFIFNVASLGNETFLLCLVYKLYRRYLDNDTKFPYKNAKLS